MVIRSSHSLRGSSTTSRRSIIRSVWRALAACFSAESTLKAVTNLSLSDFLRRAFFTPTVDPVALHTSPLLQPAAGVGVLVVRLARVPARDLALGEVAVVAAVVDGDLLLRQVQLDDPGHRAGEELPVVADDDGRAAQAR